MKLEQSLYEARPVEELRVYQVGDLESLSAVVLGYGSGVKMPGEKIGGGLMSPKVGSIRLINPTEYNKLLSNANQTIGITHHPIGLGKLKIVDHSSKIEYGVPIIDLTKPLKNWRIDKK